MATPTPLPAEADFRHQSCVYGSDEEFLAMAVPFARDGLRRGEPVLVSTTQANQELLDDVLGADAGKLVQVEPACFERRPPQLAAALHRYWTRYRSTTPGTTVRVLAEPARVARGAAEWKLAEAGFNVSLAGTGIWLVCPYDTRVFEAGAIEDARRAHPEFLVDGQAKPSEQFTAPARVDGFPASPPPLGEGADIFRFEGDLIAVRRYVLEKAGPLLQPENAVAMFGIAVGEAIAYLIDHGINRAEVWVRPAAGRVVCTLHSDEPLDLPPFFGSRPPDLRRSDTGLWMTDQICEWLDISSDSAGCTIELATPGSWAGEGTGTLG
ncbi:anti-sigma factor RsbA family regulatory protein [Amycolatopsis sp. NPDC088138]|uniref:anti-sigma factor RsbA family regulatory protein n=1 Tax=Amycolatopsis sp. NPDC088138 TaxID=3363938 RepID=UPI00382C9F36